MIPKVSVLMITFNQEQYIGQAIQSVIDQKVNFDYEIVIGEDCSTDNTLSICQEFQQKYPKIVHLLEHKKNLGMAENFFSTLSNCTGEYLAILEGDDFWINSLKLQKQVDFLTGNPDYAIVFTRTEAFFQDIDRPSYEIPPVDTDLYTLENLLKVNFIATCSVMYRKELIKEFPQWLNQLDMLDWPMHVIYTQRGKIGFLDKTMAKYRVHAKSNYSSRNLIQNYSGIVRFYQEINPFLEYEYSKSIYLYQANIYKEMSKIYFVNRQWKLSIQNLALAYFYRFFSFLGNLTLKRIRLK